jgi:hypothetical protein
LSQANELVNLKRNQLSKTWHLLKCFKPNKNPAIIFLAFTDY